jgi:hypothetical protein
MRRWIEAGVAIAVVLLIVGLVIREEHRRRSLTASGECRIVEEERRQPDPIRFRGEAGPAMREIPLPGYRRILWDCDGGERFWQAVP